MFHPLAPWRRRQSAATPHEYSADPFYALQHEMNRLFDDAFTGLNGGLARTMFGDAGRMSVDMRETDKAVIVEAEIPGVAEDDIDVELADNLLTIRAEKRAERKEDEGDEYHFVERSYGSFARSLTLPYDVDPDAVEAVFRNGVLKLTLPKPANATPRARKIGVRKG